MDVWKRGLADTLVGAALAGAGLGLGPLRVAGGQLGGCGCFSPPTHISPTSRIAAAQQELSRLQRRIASVVLPTRGAEAVSLRRILEVAYGENRIMLGRLDQGCFWRAHFWGSPYLRPATASPP